MSTGYFPESLKIAKVIPIYKAKSRDDFNNYRPISLLSVLSKILEKVIHKRTLHFLNSNHVLYNSQYGFRPGCSTINAVSESVTNIISSLDKHQFT